MVNDRSDTRSWTTDTSPGVVTGLDNGQSYRISVSAANWRGEGLRSDPASDAVIPATTPDGVEGFTVAPGDMHIDVWWRPPKDHGGANVTSYLVWLTAADAGDSAAHASHGSSNARGSVVFHFVCGTKACPSCSKAIGFNIRFTLRRQIVCRARGRDEGRDDARVLRSPPLGRRCSWCCSLRVLLPS